MERAELPALLILLRSHGVRRYSDGDFHLVLDPIEGPAPAESEDASPLSEEAEHEAGMSMLLRSAGGVVPERLKLKRRAAG